MTCAAATAQGRTSRLRFAFVTSALSKALAVVVQFLALPLALKYLGTDRYAAFLALQASLGWVGLVGFGLAPSLPFFISSAHTAGRYADERNIIGTATLFVVMAASMLFFVLNLAATVLPPQRLIGAFPNIPASELTTAYRIVAAFVTVQIIAGMVPSIRSGYQELHYCYVWTALANITIIGTLVIFSMRNISIWGLFLLLYGPITASMLFDSVVLISQRPYLVCALPHFRRTLKSIGPHARSVMAAQVSSFVFAYLPIVIVSHLTDAKSTAAYGSLMQPLIMGASGLNLIVQPLVPAIANARAHHDNEWILRTYIHTIAIIVAICFFLAFSLALYGPEILRVWLGRDLGVSRQMCAEFGPYFLVWMSSTFHFNFINALGELRKLGRIYLIEGAAAVALGTVLTICFGVEGMVAGLTIGMACVTGWYLPFRTWDAIREVGSGPRALDAIDTHST